MSFARRLSIAGLLAVAAALGPSGRSPAWGADGPDPRMVPFVLPWDGVAPSFAPGPGPGPGRIEAPAGRRGFIGVKNGHLWDGAKRIRLLGVNLCFGANFPAPSASPLIARRLARFGVNAVRLHHMDMFAAPGGIFAQDKVRLDPGRLARLDALAAALKAEGIYLDLNLHVSRSYPGFPVGENVPSFHKGIDLYHPEMLEWQKRYARDLLGRVNPHTKTRYADEPSVAIVEINNENALMFEWRTGTFDRMPSSLTGELKRQWNAWLGARYPNTDALKAAWDRDSQPGGGELLANGDFREGRGRWNLERHQGAQAEADILKGDAQSPRAVRIQVSRPGKEAWHVQLNQGGLKVAKGRSYVVAFRARGRGPSATSINATFGQGHEPWRVFGSQNFEIGTDWRTFRHAFAVGEDDSDARLAFGGMGTRTGSWEIAEVSLRPASVYGLRPDERPGQVAAFTKADFAERSAQAKRDWMRFLWETEERYWLEMRRFLKEEIGTKSLIVGTQGFWSPFSIQSRMDAIDSHAYWQHPHFPGRSWDMNDWTVGNVPMAGESNGGTLPDLAMQRAAGMPFFCTEYNHAAPNVYGSEGFLLLGAFAAFQDWDAIFAFAYSHRGGDDWDKRMIPSFFDIDQHPGKMATLPAVWALFHRGDADAPPSIAPKIVEATADQVFEQTLSTGPGVRADHFGLNRLDALQSPIAMRLADDDRGRPRRPAPSRTSGPSAVPMRWLAGQGGRPGSAIIDTAKSKAVIGAKDGQDYRMGDVSIRTSGTIGDWSIVALTVMSGDSFQGPGSILITAVGQVENTDMPWKNAEKTTVGADWGRPPSLIEGVAARIALPVPPSRVQAWALNEQGKRGKRLAIADGPSPNVAILEIGPRSRTLWYEVQIASPRPRR